MIDAVTNLTNRTVSDASAAGLGSAASKDMGKEEFLKLLVAQLENQDPLKPQENSAFVAELAQFSNLEQTIGINDRLDTLRLQNQGMQNSQVISMVGKTAIVRGSMITAEGSGQDATIAFELEGDAADVNVTIRDLQGEDVATIRIGERRAGQVQAMWNGNSDDGTVMPAGTYTVHVGATSEAGGNVSTSQETTGTVDAVSFDKGYPVLQLSNGVSVPVSDLLRIEQ